MNRQILFSLLIVCTALPLSGRAYAQTTSLSLCANTTTGKIRAVRRCASTETELSTSNFAGVIGVGDNAPTPTPGPQGTATPRPNGVSSVNLSTCYKATGQTRGTPQNGELSVAVQCNRPTQVLLSFEFDSNDTSQAQPTLLRQTFLYNGSIPNGVQVSTKGASNRFYTLLVTGVCCDRSS